MITQSDLDQFTGTECYHRYIFGMLLTDGVKYLCDQARCYWFIDLIGSWQKEITQRHGSQPFQTWTLTQNDRKEWVARCEDGNNNYLASQIIEYSDFPLDRCEVWLVDNVALLPSEY